MKNPLEHFRPWDADRFHSKYKRGAPDDCWLWEGSIGTRGYGFFPNGKNQRGKGTSHRIAYALANGPFDYSLFVCHHCDNRKCVNPAHLFLGTHTDNVRDMIAKGRAHFQTHPSLPKPKVLPTLCKRGHFYDIKKKSGTRVCSECRKIQRHFVRCVNILNFILG